MRLFPSVMNLMCLFLLGMTLAHAQNEKRTAIKIVVRDAQMRPVPEALVDSTFTQTQVKSKFFACEMRHAPVKLQCTTDAAGECVMQVPVAVSPSSKQCVGPVILGVVDSIAARGVRTGGVKIEKEIWRGSLREETPSFLILTNGTEARLSTQQKVASSAAIAASLEPLRRGANTLILSSADAYKLLYTAPLTDRTIQGYLRSSTDLANGVTGFELRVNVPFDSNRDVMRGGTSKATDTSMAVVNGETWQLPGVRILQMPRSAGPQVRFGSPKPDDDEDAGVREVIAFPLTQTQVDTLLASYVEGSDGAVKLTLSKADGGHTLLIPLVEVKALMIKLAELRAAK